MTNNMINEEAIEFIKTDISRLWNTPQNLKHKEVLEMAVKALEQEPKTNVLDKIITEIDTHREILKTMAVDDWYGGKINGYDCAIEIINKYKALEQEPCENAISRQQVKSDYADWFCCSECGSIELKRSKYCPNCGAKMAESEEE